MSKTVVFYNSRTDINERVILNDAKGKVTSTIIIPPTGKTEPIVIVGTAKHSKHVFVAPVEAPKVEAPKVEAPKVEAKGSKKNSRKGKKSK